MNIATRSSKGKTSLSALRDFANVGEDPGEWRRFRQKWPHFFPEERSQFERDGLRTFTDWIYQQAEEWSGLESDLRSKLTTPLLWYRDCLRAAWARNDPDGSNLAVLLGFEVQLPGSAVMNRLNQLPLASSFLVPGQPTLPTQRSTIGGLPQGRPFVNGIKGEIEWKFGCPLQEAVYRLVQQRWRAKVCSNCGVYFLAKKPAQSACSTRCSLEIRRRSQLEYWNRAGHQRRAARSSKEDKK